MGDNLPVVSWLEMRLEIKDWYTILVVLHGTFRKETLNLSGLHMQSSYWTSIVMSMKIRGKMRKLTREQTNPRRRGLWGKGKGGENMKKNLEVPISVKAGGCRANILQRFTLVKRQFLSSQHFGKRVPAVIRQMHLIRLL